MTQVTSRSRNPIHEARKLLGLTLAQASGEAGVHLQAFFLQEKGVYNDILPGIAEWLKVNDGYLPQMEEEYHAFQREQRRSYGEQLGFPIFELGPPEWTNAFVGFRTQLGLSRMGFAKRFCVHPGMLYRVEQGISLTMPDQLANALLHAGLPTPVVNELRYRMEET